ncbi:MAG: CoA-binding protein, partial [Candidatus Helarchaeota archaeon]
MSINNHMDKLFYPRSIAIIEAASKREWQVLGIKNLNYQGNLYLVSKNEEEIAGIKCYQDISDLPDKIDHAIIVVKRDRLRETILQCIEKKFYTLHIFTAGGAEFDEEGIKIEREIYEIIKKSDMRVIGPNCMGIYSPEGKISYGPEFSKKVGKVSFVSQSGDLTTQYILRSNYNGVFFSKVASIGNSIDLTISDFINYFNADEKTEIIGVYFEGFPRFQEKEGLKFWNALKNVKKPLLLLRGGISHQGKRAAVSHTGTLAANDRIWDAIYKQTRALRVETFEELVDSTLAFNLCQNLYPKVKSIVLITWSGGKAVIATDQLVRLGIDVPE